MKPIIKYRGGKSKEIPNILRYIPCFSGRYVEPFFGGGALFFYLQPQKAIINDINKPLIDFYLYVRDNYEDLRRELDEIEQLYSTNRRAFEELKKLNPEKKVEDRNEELYYLLRDMFNGKREKEYSDALLYYYINKTAYSGMIRYNANGEFNVPFGRYRSLNTAAVSSAHSELLQKAEIFNTDYSEIFALCKEDDFVFINPPYDCTFSDYGNQQHREGFSIENHQRLAKDFALLPCKALMVIGSTPLTESLYRDYIVDRYDKNYSVNIRNRFKAKAEHIVVSNYKYVAKDKGIYTNIQYPVYNNIGTSQLRLFEQKHPYGKN